MCQVDQLDFNLIAESGCGGIEPLSVTVCRRSSSVMIVLMAMRVLSILASEEGQGPGSRVRNRRCFAMEMGIHRGNCPDARGTKLGPEKVVAILS